MLNIVNVASHLLQTICRHLHWVSERHKYCAELSAVYPASCKPEVTTRSFVKIALCSKQLSIASNRAFACAGVCRTLGRGLKGCHTVQQACYRHTVPHQQHHSHLEGCWI